MLAACEIPTGIGAEELVVSVGIGTGRLKEGLPGSLRVAGVVSERQPELIVLAETVTEIAGECAVDEGVDVLRAIGGEIGRSTGVIEVAKKAADLRATAAGIEISTFGKNGDFGNARGAAMGKDLDHAGDGVGAVDGGFGAAHDFNLVHVVERKVGEVNGVAGFVDGRAVHQDFG